MLLFGGNLLSQLLFAITLGACVRAFGLYVPLSTLTLINTVVTLFAGILPVPGGVRMSEAGLSLGLTRAGIPSETAFAVALTPTASPPSIYHRSWPTRLPLDDRRRYL